MPHSTTLMGVSAAQLMAAASVVNSGTTMVIGRDIYGDEKLNPYDRFIGPAVDITSAIGGFPGFNATGDAKLIFDGADKLDFVADGFDYIEIWQGE